MIESDVVIWVSYGIGSFATGYGLALLIAATRRLISLI